MKALRSVHAYTSSEAAPAETAVRVSGVKRLFIILLAVSWWAGGVEKSLGSAPAGSDDGTAKEAQKTTAEFRIAWAEYQLAKTESPYLVLDVERTEIVLKLKGVPVWSCPIKFEESDSAGVVELKRHFGGDRTLPIAVLTGKHLYAARKVFSDSLLTVVGATVRVRPQEMQRYEPSHFRLRCGCQLAIDVRTDVEAARPMCWAKNALATVEDGLLAPLTKTKLAITMEPGDALTLYRFAERRLPILIHANPAP